MSIYSHKSFGGILLVAGTSIGAGMLALPITTGVAGFFPSLALFLVCFAYMLMNLFILLEANLYSTELEANIISMSERLGFVGQATAWLSFLLLLYAAAAAYLSGGGSLIGKLINATLNAHISPTQGTWIFMTGFGLIVFFGTTLIDYINRVLMIGLFVSYLALIIFVLPHVTWTNLNVYHPTYLWAAVPIVLLSFTSHIILPSLRTYLENNIVHLKKVLILGSIVPLVFYVVWQLLIVGVLPIADLFKISSGAHPVAALTSTLKTDLRLSWIALEVGAFSFFALVTSFLGVTLSLADFLADGFQIKRDVKGRFIILSLTILPPLAFALYFPKGFVIALSYAGVFVAILYGILPACMVWKARYTEKLKADYKIPGGKPVLVLSIIGGILAIIFQVAATMHWLPSV